MALKHRGSVSHMTHRTVGDNSKPTDPKVVRRDPDTGRFVPVNTSTTVTRLDTPPPPSMIPEIGAGLAQALFDATAEAWRTTAATRHHRSLAAAVEYGDRIAHSDEAVIS